MLLLCHCNIPLCLTGPGIKIFRILLFLFNNRVYYRQYTGNQYFSKAIHTSTFAWREDEYGNKGEKLFHLFSPIFTYFHLSSPIFTYLHLFSSIFTYYFETYPISVDWQTFSYSRALNELYRQYPYNSLIIWLISLKISCDSENFLQIKFVGSRGKSQPLNK